MVWNRRMRSTSLLAANNATHAVDKNVIQTGSLPRTQYIKCHQMVLMQICVSFNKEDENKAVHFILVIQLGVTSNPLLDIPWVHTIQVNVVDLQLCVQPVTFINNNISIANTSASVNQLSSRSKICLLSHNHYTIRNVNGINRNVDDFHSDQLQNCTKLQLQIKILLLRQILSLTKFFQVHLATAYKI